MGNEWWKMADPLEYSLLKENAISHRRGATQAEDFLWQQLGGKALGVRFRRQHVIGPYIADFAALACELIIEVDGGYHTQPQQQIDDQDRTDFLNRMGFRVLRFTNEEVLFDTERVLQVIKDHIQLYEQQRHR